jgi:predicted transcriptional regulator
MTTRETRRESYEKVKPEIPNRRALILQILEKGPKTAHEIVESLLSRKVIPYYDRNFVSPRLTELKQMELVEVVGTKYETRTERKVSLWQLKEETE